MTGRFRWLFLLAVIGLVQAAPAQSHNLSVSHVQVRVDPADRQALTVEVDLSLKDLALTVPLDANHDESVTWAELAAARPAIEALVAEGLGLGSLGGACSLSPTGFGTRRYDDGAYASLVLRGACPSAGALRVNYSLFFDRDPQHRAIITLDDAGRMATAIARVGDASPQLDIRVDNVFGQFLREGIHHILIGYDHIAFLISLVLPALLVWRAGRWQAEDAVRRRMIDVVWLVTAFTVAHSITLTLAALGWVVPASKPIECLIAASVVLAALNNLRPLVTSRLWLLSLGFGLIHGFGFAGALGGIGLPAESRFLALLGFNLGVELGQLLLLAVLLPCLYLVRRKPWYARIVLPVLSLSIAALAMVWLVQRLSS